jgi:hypothetical protein
MDIPYKGYTIMPNSERQPDGRWLPVVDLEADNRGVVTPKPSLRATPLEVRATRADADAVAVKMAKAWIETIERAAVAGAPATDDEARALAGAPRPSAPIGNAVASPRIPSGHRGQDVRAEPPRRARGIEAKERPAPTDTLGWSGLHEVIGLDSDEKSDRFIRLLAVHALLDRLVTLVLATNLAASESKPGPRFETMLDAMASLPIAARVALASTLNVVPPAAAETLLEIDRTRNKVVYSKPTRGKSAGDVSGAVESVPRDVWDKSLRKAFEAAQDVMSALRAAAREA